MKKILSVVLATAMMLSMTINAFAEYNIIGTYVQSGATTLTVDVPDPTYNIHYTASTNLVYGNTDHQLVAELYVTDAQYLKDTQHICVAINTANLKDGDNEIPVEFEWKHTGDPGYSDDFVNWPGLYTQATRRYSTVELYATVTDAAWKAAKPGTYTSTITYEFKIPALSD